MEKRLQASWTLAFTMVKAYFLITKKKQPVDRTGEPIRQNKGCFSERLLSAQSEFFDKCAVTFNVLVFQVREQFAALTDHFKQTATGMMILLVRPQVVGKVHNVFRKDSDLYFRGACIGFMNLMLRDQLLLTTFC
jgi:hypothetical protein